MKKDGIQTRNRKLSGKTKKKRSGSDVGSSATSFLLPDVLSKSNHLSSQNLGASYNDVKPYLSLGSPYMANGSYSHHSTGEMKPYLSLSVANHHQSNGLSSSLANAFANNINIVGALA